MRVLGYSFDRAAEALLARSVLVERYRLVADDVRVRDVANDGVMLALTAQETLVSDIERLMAAHGGERTTDIDARHAESATR